MSLDRNLKALDRALVDGRLTVRKSRPPKYNVKAVLAEQKRVGRVLTSKETKKFERNPAYN